MGSVKRALAYSSPQGLRHCDTSPLLNRPRVSYDGGGV